MTDKKKNELEPKKKRALGRGLDALMTSPLSATFPVSEPHEKHHDDEQRVLSIPIKSIHPNPNQPRRIFDLDSLEGLAQSIKTQGVLQPLLVKKVKSGYELIAGERRLRAAKIAKLTEVLCIVREIDEKGGLAVSLIENLQREDLNPIELARGIREMQDKLDLTQQEIATELGMSRPNIANTLRLLELTAVVQTMVERGELTAGTARSLVMLPPDLQIDTAERIAIDGLSTRQAEALVKEVLESLKRKAGGLENDDCINKDDEINTDRFENPAIKSIAYELTRQFGTRVVIRTMKDGGTISFRYFDESDLNRLLSLFGLSEDPI